MAISSAVTQARGTSIIVPTRYSTVTPVSANTLAAVVADDLLLVLQLLAEADQRDHDLRVDRRRLPSCTCTAASKIARACMAVISG